MINKLLKNELDQLKITIAKEMNATWKLSYSDVIKYLIKNFKESRRIEVPLDSKLWSGISFRNSRLKTNIKLEGKKIAAFSFES